MDLSLYFLGNLNLPEFKTTRLILKTLKDVKIEDLFTTSTNQVIDADIEFANIIAKNIITNKTNDIKLSEAAVQFGNDTLVEGNKIYFLFIVLYPFFQLLSNLTNCMSLES